MAADLMRLSAKSRDRHFQLGKGEGCAGAGRGQSSLLLTVSTAFLQMAP